MSTSKHFYIKARACKGCLLDNAGVSTILSVVPVGTIRFEVIPAMEIGSIIKSARSEAGLTQEQAAEALCVSRQTVSNWENGKTYPDIISVIKMSGLYSVSLDRLLKEETSMKQSYREFLEESTNTVKSNEKRAKLTLALVTLVIWSISLIAFWLVRRGTDFAGYSLTVMGAVLPILFFTVSFIIGLRNYFGKLKWLAAPIFSIMYSLSGNIASVATDEALYRTVVWPDFTKLLIGVLISLAGLVIGMLVQRGEGKTAK